MCNTGVSHSNSSSNSDHFHVPGGSVGDGHFDWFQDSASSGTYNDPSPISFAQFQTQDGQELNGTIDTQDASVPGCTQSWPGASGVGICPNGAFSSGTTGTTGGTTGTTGTTGATTGATTGTTGPQPCTNYYLPGIAIPSGYGASYDLTGGGQTEITASCAKTTPTLDVGRNVSTDYVYKLAYIYQGSAWAPQNLTSASALQSSNWYTGKASITLPSSSITSSWTYAVGYVCAYVSPSTGSGSATWKCGCADAACTTGYWQLQAYKR
jgi:hypothetical protein